jgi:hypothetical protein
VTTGGLRVGMGSKRLAEVRGLEAEEAPRPDFKGVSVPQASPSDVRGEGAELCADGRGG